MRLREREEDRAYDLRGKGGEQREGGKGGGAENLKAHP